ncbi:MAG: hypothetical protein JEZ08_22450 [Clostridiales bacterium]|nr:hypothetical protein [Clostridiales bacterium]
MLDINECCVDVISKVIASDELQENTHKSIACNQCKTMHRIIETKEGHIYSEGIEGDFLINMYRVDDYIVFENDKYEIINFHGVTRETKCNSCENEFSVQDVTHIVKNESGELFYFTIPECFNCSVVYEPTLDEYVDDVKRPDPGDDDMIL